jgi:hypothetical protein
MKRRIDQNDEKHDAPECVSNETCTSGRTQLDSIWHGWSSHEKLEHLGGFGAFPDVRHERKGDAVLKSPKENNLEHFHNPE